MVKNSPGLLATLPLILSCVAEMKNPVRTVSGLVIGVAGMNATIAG